MISLDLLNALRTARNPLTSLDIARQVIALRRLPEDQPTVVMIRKRVSAGLWKLAKAGTVREVARCWGPLRVGRWCAEPP